jgi:hypothetical protein
MTIMGNVLQARVQAAVPGQDSRILVGVNQLPARLSSCQGTIRRSPLVSSEESMTVKTVSCTFDKHAVWKKVRDRKPVVLDMNFWINMGDEKFFLATQVKDTLRRLVSKGLIFCPLSFGLAIQPMGSSEKRSLTAARLPNYTPSGPE